MSEQSASSQATLTGRAASLPCGGVSAPPAYRLYDAKSITIATVLGSPVAGTGLMALNYRRLGRTRSAAMTLAIGVAATATGIALGSVLPSYASSAIAVGLLVATMNAAKALQGTTIDKHLRRGGRLSSRWAAAGVGIVCPAIAFGAPYSFYLVTQSTKKIVVGSKDEVDYSGAATKHDAEALGAALQASGYFRGRGVGVFLSKGPTATTVSFVVDKRALNDSNVIGEFEEVGREVAPSVGGFPIKLRLADPHDKTLQEFTIGRLVIGAKAGELYYYGTATEADARALGRSLKTSGFLQDRGATVLLSKGSGYTAVSFVLAEGAWNNPHTVTLFETLVRRAASSVGGFPISLRLVNSHLLLEKELEVRR